MSEGVDSRCDQSTVANDCPGGVVAPLASMATIFAILALLVFICCAACALCQWLRPWTERRDTGPELAVDGTSDSSQDPCSRSESSSMPEERKSEVAPVMDNNLSICVIMAGEEQATCLAHPCP